MSLRERPSPRGARDTCPPTSKVYCQRVDEWPADAEVIERVATRTWVRRGAASDLVLDRGRENRSQLVMTPGKGGRQVIFWQTARTAKQARPGVRTHRPRRRRTGPDDRGRLPRALRIPFRAAREG